MATLGPQRVRTGANFKSANTTTSSSLTCAKNAGPGQGFSSAMGICNFHLGSTHPPPRASLTSIPLFPEGYFFGTSVDPEGLSYKTCSRGGGPHRRRDHEIAAFWPMAAHGGGGVSRREMSYNYASFSG